MSSEEFYTRSRASTFAVFAPLLLIVAAWRFWQYYQLRDALDLDFIVFAVFAVLMAIGFRNRERPVVEISQERVTYGHIMWPWTRSVALRDIVEVGDLRGINKSLRLRTTSGRIFRLPLLNVTVEDRLAIRESIKRRIAQHEHVEQPS